MFGGEGGRFNGGFSALQVWGACMLGSVYMKRLIFGILCYQALLENARPRLINVK